MDDISQEQIDSALSKHMRKRSRAAFDGAFDYLTIAHDPDEVLDIVRSYEQLWLEMNPKL